MWRASFVALLALVLTAPAAQAQFHPSFVLAKDFAYLINPPKMVSMDMVQFVEPSPSGRYALVGGVDLKGGSLSRLSQQPKSGDSAPELKACVLDVLRDKVTPIKLSREEFSFIYQPSWASDGASAFVLEQKEDPNQPGDGPVSFELKRISMIDASVTSVYRIPQAVQLSRGAVFSSPSQPYVVMLQTVPQIDPATHQATKSSIGFVAFDNSGKLLRQATTEVKGYATTNCEWSQDGKQLVMIAFVQGQGLEGTQKFWVFDPSNGVVTERKEKPETYQPAPFASELSLETSNSIVSTQDGQAKVRPLWLRYGEKSDMGVGLIAADCDGPYFWLPQASRALYIDKNRLYSTQVEKVDIELFKKARDAAERSAALSRAKQVALALSLFLSDNDDVFPSSGGFQDAVKPYLKDPALLDGFVFTAGGKRAGDFLNPSKEMMGYIDINGGRCVAYADGHVRFVGNP